MTLNEIQGRLEAARGTDAVLRIDGATTGVEDIDAALGAAFPGGMRVEGASIALDGDRLTVGGTAQTDGGALLGALTARFHAGAGGAITLSLEVPLAAEAMPPFWPNGAAWTGALRVQTGADADSRLAVTLPLGGGKTAALSMPLPLGEAFGLRLDAPVPLSDLAAIASVLGGLDPSSLLPDVIAQNLSVAALSELTVVSVPGGAAPAFVSAAIGLTGEISIFQGRGAITKALVRFNRGASGHWAEIEGGLRLGDVEAVVETRGIDFQVNAWFTAQEGLSLAALLEKIAPGAGALGDVALYGARLSVRPWEGVVTLSGEIGDSDNRLELSAEVTRVSGRLGVRAGLYAGAGTPVDLLALARGTLSAIGGAAELAALDLPDGLAVTIDEAELSLDSGVVSGRVQGALRGNGKPLLSVEVAREGAGGWALSGSTAPGTSLDLSGLLTDLFEAAGVGAPEVLPEIRLDNLSVSLDTGTGVLQFSGRTAEPATLTLGSVDYTLDCGVRIDVSRDAATGATRVSAALTAEVSFGAAKFALEYEIGRSGQALRGAWTGADGATLGFGDIAAALGIDHALALPSGISVGLNKASFEMLPAEGRFVLAAHSNALGDAFFVAERRSGAWGFVFGCILDLSKINGFPSLGPLSLKQTALLLSTVSNEVFQLPALPALPAAPADGALAFPALSAQTMPIRPGVIVAAVLDIAGSSSGDVVVQSLKSFAPSQELLVQAVIGQRINESALVAYLPGSLGLAGDGLVLSNPYIQIQLTPPGVMVGGSIYIPINEVTLKATGRLAMNLQQVQAMFSIEALADGKPAELPFPLGLKGVHLSQLSLGVGMVFTPPSVNLGLGGRFNIVGQPPDTNDFMIVLQVVEKLPNLLYLSTYIETISVSAIVAAVTGEVRDDIPALLQEIHADRVSLFWSQRPGIFLPDGSVSRPGFGFNGFLTIGTFQVYANLDVDPIAGISGAAQISPIAWAGVFSMTGTGPEVKITEEQVDGLWRTARSHPVGSGGSYPTREVVVMRPGGPAMAIQSKTSPYVQVGATISLFDIAKVDVEVEVANDHFSFLVDASLGDANRFTILCTISAAGFRGRAEFSRGIDAHIGPIKILGVDLGTIHLDVSVSGVIDVEVNGSGFRIAVSGGFEFDGTSIILPPIVIEAEFRSFEEIPARIVQQIQDHAEDLFKDLIGGAAKLLEDAGKVAEEVIGAIDGEVKKIGEGAAAAAGDIVTGTTDLFNQVASGASDVNDATRAIAEDAGRIALESEKKVEEIGNTVAAETAAMAREAEQTLANAASEVQKIGEGVGREVTQIGNQAAKVAGDAVRQAEAIGKQAEQVASQVIAGAEAAARQILSFAEDAAAAMRKQAEEIYKAIEDAAKLIASTAEDAWNTVKKY